MRNQGYIRQRGKESWELKFDAGRDPATGTRYTQFVTFRGTRKEARLKLAELIASVGKGSYVNQSSLTVYEHVSARIEQWQALASWHDSGLNAQHNFLLHGSRCLSTGCDLVGLHNASRTRYSFCFLGRLERHVLA